MDGDDVSSTDLHLACHDRLLVGQVAETTQIDSSDALASTDIHNRKLQIWDFATGHCLEVNHNELCTAMCMMNEGESVVLGRTDRIGGTTTIVVWDIAGNEAVRKLRYQSPIGFADHISFLCLSPDDRYVVAGFQNSHDRLANYYVFDLSLDERDVAEPRALALDADVHVAVMLAHNEAVTGTRRGALTIWSLRNGKTLRQLLDSNGGQGTLIRMGVNATTLAHTNEVKDIALSRDGKRLVSASADSTLKVWNMEEERHMLTLKGHAGEVWCCTISQDDEIIVSGSRDNTIRLWRMRTGAPVCTYSTSMDIFTVRMSRDKRTIVALGDKEGSRKLVMLKIVRTRNKAPSRGRGRGVVPPPYGTIVQKSRTMGARPHKKSH